VLRSLARLVERPDSDRVLSAVAFFLFNGLGREAGVDEIVLRLPPENRALRTRLSAALADTRAGEEHARRLFDHASDPATVEECLHRLSIYPWRFCFDIFEREARRRLRREGTAVAAQEYVHPFERFKEGSWVRKTTTHVKPRTTSQKTTLKSISKEEIVLALEIQMPGMAPMRNESRISRKGWPGGPADSSKKLGDEEIEVDDRKLTCEIWQYSTEDWTTKAWISKDARVPGDAVKTETARPKRGVETTSKRVKLSEKVKLGDTELDCAVFDVTIKEKDATMSGRSWRCADMPGFEVKTEMKGQSDGLETEYRTEVAEWEKK
jgi:hypothetical protein